MFGGTARSHVLVGGAVVVIATVLGFGALLVTRPEKAFWGLALLACIVVSYLVLGQTNSGDVLEPRIAVGFGGGIVAFIVWFVSIFLDGDLVLLGAGLILFLLLLALGGGAEDRH